VTAADRAALEAVVARVADRQPASATPGEVAVPLAEVHSAAQVLVASDPGRLSRHRIGLVAWLDALEGAAIGDPFMAGEAADLRRMLGGRPTVAELAATDGWFEEFERTSDALDPVDVAHRLMGCVWAWRAAGHPLPTPSKRMDVLGRALARGSDPLGSYYAVQALAALRTDRTALAPIADDIADRLGRDGLVRERARFVGDPSVALAVSELQLAAGQPTEDASLRRALERLRPPPVPTRDDPLATASWASAYLRAGGTIDRATEDRAWEEVRRALPRTIGEEDVHRWARVVALALQVGAPWDLPRVRSWPLRDEADVNAAAELINAFADLDSLPGLDPSFVRRFALVARRTHFEEVAPWLRTALALVRLGRAPGPLPPASAVGCGRFRTLVKERLRGEACDLEATTLALQLASLDDEAAPLRARIVAKAR
jgi:hypothetical protein